jgi:CTP:phosphocholine cytidylyltransferase-like protein
MDFTYDIHMIKELSNCYCLLEANSLLAGIIMNSLIKIITTFGMRKCKFYWNYIVKGYEKTLNMSFNCSDSHNILF